MEWKCEFCNCICKSRRKLFEHNKICSERAKMPKDSLGRIIRPGHTDGLKAYIDSIRGKTQKGHKHSEESKKKISKGRLKALRERKR